MTYETDRPARVVVVGAGPRGLATAARLLDLAADRCEVHLVDLFPGGRVWRREQDPNLLMNSRLRQATLFADESIDGVRTAAGPTFATWCAETAPHLDLPAEAAAELRSLGPDDFSSRALFGHYTHWVLDRLRDAGAVVHADEAVAIEPDADGDHTVRLASGAALRADAVVLALGHLPMASTAQQAEWARFAQAHDLVYVPPGPAAEAAMDAIGAGEPVAVLGAGLNFYDVMALCTLSRGGRFERLDGRLRYVPSGQEPVLWVGSARGVPYVARAERASANALAVMTADWVAARIRRGRLDLNTDVWPDVVRDMRHAWYQAALEQAGREVEPLELATALTRLPAEGPEVDRWCAHTFPDIAPFRLEELCDPLKGIADPAKVERRLRDVLDSHVASAYAQPRGPVTAVGERLAIAKDVVRHLVANEAFTADSVLGDLQGWFRSIGGFIAAGPPVERVEQLAALIDAGLVRVAGRRAVLTCDEEVGSFVLGSDTLAGLQVRAVIEARLPAEDLRHTTSRLVSQLLSSGTARPASLEDEAGPRTTGGLDVTRAQDPRPCRVIAADGTPWESIFALGLPVQPLEWNIANLPQPHTGARTIVQADRIARQILAVHERRSHVT
ncbi:FAD/NAD(P)-binding protein [Micromonospora sonchi]|uniref:FAD/NAD(P)-binding protein n=1 Tax=Micromonospora sonchi TaxID=1763543 RepID=UPI001669C943|nr:FAD/NAD(P)-binding protein [Micromonospora sonchi]